MKKNRLLSLFLALVMLFGVVSALGGSAMAADVAINKTNFPDANFREFVERYDTNNNGSLSAAELAAEEKMDCNNRNIANLKGIEHFTALTYLRCDKNLLTSLDVSRNTALTELNCDDNKLTSLDVSGCIALTRLDCYKNQLTRLDVSRNTALTRLDCQLNNLTSLDVSRNTALTELLCQSNQLTSLDVSRNTALTKLLCSNNQLTSLDVSRNTALTYLDCTENQLRSLDVSRNTALTGLYCSENQLTSLDVSRNTALTKLQCYSNKLTNLDVSSNTALTKLLCQSNQLTSLDVGAVPAIRDAVVNGKKEVIFNYYCYESGQGALWVDRTVTIVTTIPAAITGSVAIEPTSPSIGYTLRYKLSGSAAGIPSGKIRSQWQRSANGTSGWTNVTEYSAGRYVVTNDDSDQYFRVVITADGYSGSITSPAVHVSRDTLKGEIRISPSSPKVGETLSAELLYNIADISPSKLHYQWQMYVEVSGRGRYVSINGATKSAYTVTQSAGARIRLSVTADGYDGELYSNAVTVTAGVPTLSGSVSISPANPNTGDTLTANLGGIAASILPSLIHYQWQSLRTNAITGATSFSDISGATGKTYTTSTLASNQYRVKVTADGFDGVLYSDAVTATEGTSSYPKGDVDRSGQVGNSDLIMVARHVVHIITLSGEQFTLGDMDNNKVIDNKDIISVARKVVGL